MMVAAAMTSVNSAVQSFQSMPDPHSRLLAGEVYLWMTLREWAARQGPLNGSVKAGLSFIEHPSIAREPRFNVEYLGFGLINLAGQFQALALLSLQEGFVFSFKLPLRKLGGLELSGQRLIESAGVCDAGDALGDGMPLILLPELGEVGVRLVHGFGVAGLPGACRNLDQFTGLGF